MIGKLKGRVDALLDETVILDVGGVGYEVWCPARILSSLEAGTAAEIWIETVVREDMIRLYGFSSNAERDWFRMLQQVQGVGAKVAMAVLGVMKPSELANAIALGDKAALSRAPGVGKRVAERLAIELKDKVGGLAVGTEAAVVQRSTSTVGLPRESRISRARTRSMRTCVIAVSLLQRRRPASPDGGRGPSIRMSVLAGAEGVTRRRAPATPSGGGS